MQQADVMRFRVNKPLDPTVIVIPDPDYIGRLLQQRMREVSCQVMQFEFNGYIANLISFVVLPGNIAQFVVEAVPAFGNTVTNSDFQDIVITSIFDLLYNGAPSMMAGRNGPPYVC